MDKTEILQLIGDIESDSKREEAVITSGPYEMCGTVCCSIDIHSSVVCIDNLKKNTLML